MKNVFNQSICMFGKITNQSNHTRTACKSIPNPNGYKSSIMCPNHTSQTLPTNPKFGFYFINTNLLKKIYNPIRNNVGPTRA